MALAVSAQGTLGALLGQTFVLLAKRDDLLELDTRRRIFEVVERFPGLHLSEIARRTELETNHAKYHLEYLEKHGLVSSRKEGGYWVFFPRTEGELGNREVLDRADKGRLALLRRPVPLHVAVLLLNESEASHGWLLQRVSVASATLHYHLKRMEGAELVASRKQGRERIYQLVDPDRVAALLVRFRPPDELVSGFLAAWEQLELD